MGMFDQLTPFSEHFKEYDMQKKKGDFFTLQDARVGNEMDTIHGKGTPAELKIEGKWYSVFGQALVNQIRRLDRGDLPAEVAVVRVMNKAQTNEYKQLATRKQIESDDIPF